METMRTKEYPIYEYAAKIIQRQVRMRGYGLIIPNERLDRLFELKTIQKTDVKPKKEIDDYSMIRFGYIESLKAKLLEHNIKLFATRHDSYKILTPDEQVLTAAKKHFKKSHTELRLGLKTLENINAVLLSEPAKQERERMLRIGNLLRDVRRNNQKYLPEFEKK